MAVRDAFANGKALIVFFTGGDPDIETTEKLVYASQEAGADLIEIGIPFSDPIAEGPVIQDADERALASGTKLDDLFSLVARVRRNTSIPIAFMTYMNPVYKYGVAEFTRRCAEVGVDAAIIPDMPYEEAHEFLDHRFDPKVELISMITPTSAARAQMIAEQAEGFLYCVSSLGVTGIRKELSTEIGDIIAGVKQVNDIPCAIGFGISDPQQAAHMAAISDGVIVGSAIVAIVAQYGRDSIEPVREFVASLRQAIND